MTCCPKSLAELFRDEDGAAVARDREPVWVDELAATMCGRFLLSGSDTQSSCHRQTDRDLDVGDRVAARRVEVALDEVELEDLRGEGRGGGREDVARQARMGPVT